MNWFDSSLASLTKTALKEVQKKIDQALDIKDEERQPVVSESLEKSIAKSSATTSSKPIVQQQPPSSLSSLPHYDYPKVEHEFSKMRNLEKLDTGTATGVQLEGTQMETTNVKHFAEDDQKCQDIAEVNPPDETMDGGAFSGIQFVVDSENSTTVLLQHSSHTPLDQDSVSRDSLKESSVESEQSLCLASSAVMSSDSVSPIIIQPFAAGDDTQSSIKDLHIEKLTPVLEQQSVAKDALIPAADFEFSNVQVHSPVLPIGSYEQVAQLKAPEDTPSCPSSESVEIISSKSVDKSSSVEVKVLNESYASAVTSTEDVLTDRRSQESSSAIDMPAITKQPTSHGSDWSKCNEEDLYSSSLETPSVYGSFAEDSSACDSIHSASTSSTHTVLDAFPSQILNMSEGLIDTFDSEVYEIAEIKGDNLSPMKAKVEVVTADDSAISSEEMERKLMEEKEAEIESLIKEALLCTKEAFKSESSDSQGASSSPDRETSPSDRYRSKSPNAHSSYIYTSEHSSMDEIETETTTSSDIEIISNPSLDSSNGGYRPPLLLPTGVAATVWMSAQKGLRVLIPERADPASIPNEETVISSLTTSFTSISESSGDSPQAPASDRFSLQMGNLNQDLQDFKSSHKRNISSVSEYSESSSDVPRHDVDRLKKKLAHMTELIDVREAKVLELSHINSTLTESNSQLQFRLDEAEILKNGSDSNEAVREECTQRLAIMERKFQKSLKEKETMAKMVEEYREEATERRSSTELTKLLEEKEITIQELMFEGETLSKQQLNYSNIIKKLRAKEKEAENVTKDQRSKLERQSIELERLQKQLGAKEEVERKQIEAIRLLTVTNQKQEFDLKNAIADRQESDGKVSSLKDALDSVCREVAELQKTIAANDAEAQQEALSSEIDARQIMESALNELKRQNHQMQASFVGQINELQDSVRRSEDQANRKERQLKGEIGDLQKCLTESENRCKEMSDNVSAGTRPLLRQLENLHTSQRTQQEVWERLEESLLDSIRQAKKLTALSQEKEIAMKEEHSNAILELANIQTKVKEIEFDKHKLEMEVKRTRTKAEGSEEARIKESNEWEATRRSLMDEIKFIQQKNDVVQNALELEKNTATSEKRKNDGLQEQLRNRERSLAHLQSIISARASADSSPTQSVSRLSASGSVNESFHSSNCMDEVFESTLSPARGASLYDSLRGHSAMTVDIMTSALRQREGELHHVQSELARSEAQKETLGRELLLQSQKIGSLTTEAELFKVLKVEYAEMYKRYNALLQMYGEKVEEVDELKLDLSDVKEMYKVQIEQLLKKE